jgi:hypothetical protein
MTGVTEKRDAGHRLGAVAKKSSQAIRIPPLKFACYELQTASGGNERRRFPTLAEGVSEQCQNRYLF